LVGAKLGTELLHGGVDVGSGLGAGVLELALLHALVSGARLDGLAVHKLGGINLELEVGLQQSGDDRVVFGGVEMTGGNLAHKSSHALLFLQLENADEQNIVSINRLGSTSSSFLGLGEEGTSLDCSQERDGSQSSGNYTARHRHSSQADGRNAKGGGADGDGGESRTAKQTKDSS